jgi:hypothetical protein
MAEDHNEHSSDPFLSVGYNSGNMPTQKTKRPQVDFFDVDDSHAQICSTLKEKAVLKQLNEKYPGNWKLAKWYYDTPNPDPCVDNPKTHKHYLFLND